MSKIKGNKEGRIVRKGPRPLGSLTVIELEMELLRKKERNRSKTRKGRGRK